MKALIQMDRNASVRVNQRNTTNIDEGLLVFLGIKEKDDSNDIKYLVDKILNVRLFPQNPSNHGFEISVLDSSKDILVVSQFTLYGSTRKGRRPSFSKAADSEIALPIYERTLEELKKTHLNIQSGVFGAYMEITSINSGPVTIMIDSDEKNSPRKAF